LNTFCAKVLHNLFLLIPADRRNNLRTGKPGELNSNNSNAARATPDEKRFSRFQFSDGLNSMIRRKPGHAKRRCIFK
jgi:hypothetical protein